MLNALVPGVGGPMGTHASPRGLWFRPLPWAILVATASFLVLFLRHVPCLQTEATNPVNAYIRVCYNDIQTLFLAHGYGAGAWPLGGDALHFSPLTAVAALLAIMVSGAVVGDVAEVTLQTQIDQSIAFVTLTAVGLFACLLVSVVSFVRLSQRPGRSWEPFVLAASPLVLAVALVDWTLLPIALTCVALAQFASRALVSAGIMMGLAMSAGTMPIAVTLAVLVACGLRGGWDVALRFGAGAAGTALGVHLPLMLTNFDAVYGFYHGEIHKETGYGSLWYLASQLGLNLRHTGSLTFIILILGLAVLVAWLFVTRRRPRVGSLIGIFVIATTLIAPGFPPQVALWVLLATMLARPFRLEWLAVNVSGVLYYLAVWGWIGGALTSARSGPFGLYWLAILLVAGAQALVLAESLRDVVDPGRDQLRTPDRSDPIGGVLGDDETLPLLGRPPAETSDGATAPGGPVAVAG